MKTPEDSREGILPESRLINMIFIELQRTIGWSVAHIKGSWKKLPHDHIKNSYIGVGYRWRKRRWLEIRTFLYNVIISLGNRDLSYMVFLMPSMYMDYKENQKFRKCKVQQWSTSRSTNHWKTKAGDANTIGIIGNGYYQGLGSVSVDRWGG